MSAQPHLGDTPKSPVGGESGDALGYAGQRLGLPATGRGALAGWGARIAALLIDWLVANLAAFALVRDAAIWQAPVTAVDFLPLAVFGLETWLMTAFVGASIGQRVRHLVVARLDGQPVGLVRGFVRAALVLLVVPVLIVDADGRGLHDRLAGTVLVRGR
ncbi:RDD family protein [Actinopolymorpha alba]|uniref:RDD family protein n=1 Tax=Actinopolymorpha alba TaxID=533267 RepID=UPI0004769543|nr:RDD family protein [Actinopolymorpha alba]